MTTNGYQRIGKRIVHSFAPVGDRLHVAAHQSVLYRTARLADHVACQCGYLLCSGTGRCAANALPETGCDLANWTWNAERTQATHPCGAWVRTCSTGEWVYGFESTAYGWVHGYMTVAALENAIEVARGFRIRIGKRG